MRSPDGYSLSAERCDLVDSGGNKLCHTNYFDGLGRVTRSQSPDPEGDDLTDFTYDGRGRLASETNPYRAGESLPTDGTTTYQYDGLGRTLVVTYPDGAQQSTTYYGAASETTDPKYSSEATAVKRISQMDAFGNLVSVCEEQTQGVAMMGSGASAVSCGQDIAPRTGWLTQYSYDPLNHLTRVQQNGLADRAFTYNGLGRLKTASNPESGLTAYTYDSNGNVLTRTRPAANQYAPGATVTTTYQYDELNRIYPQITYSDGLTPPVSYAYDESSVSGFPAGITNPIGRLVSSGTGGSQMIRRYDTMGRVTDEWQTTPGSVWYHLPYSYDRIGEVLTAGDGLGNTLSYSYNQGRLGQMTSSVVDASHPATLVSMDFTSRQAYWPSGALESATLGNGLAHVAAYNSRHWMTAMAVGNNCTPGDGTCEQPLYQVNGFDYYGNGNLKAASDAVNGTWSGLQYDDFNRLVEGSSTQWGCFDWKYDRFGNRWQQNAHGGGTTLLQTFGSNLSAGNNQVDGACYDAAGNLLNESSSAPCVAKYVYDAENRIMVANADTSTPTQYVYDADGLRVRKATGGVSNDYLYDLSGRAITEVDAATQTAKRTELYAGGMHVGTYTNGTTYFNHSDWLGTERMRTGVDGNITEVCRNQAFGDSQQCEGEETTHHHFTGKERDDETGFDYFGARYYSSSARPLDDARLGREGGDGAVCALWQSAVAESLCVCGEQSAEQRGSGRT